MYCSEEDINEIREKINIREYISRKVKLKKINDYIYIGSCPFHKSSIQSFIVDEKQQTYGCHECGRSGDVFDFVMNCFKKSFSDAVCMLALQNDISLNRDVAAEAYYKEQSAIIEINKMAKIFYQQSLLENQSALIYLATRGIAEDTIEKFQLGYSNPKIHLYDILKEQGFNELDIKASGLVSDEDKSTTRYDKFYGRVIFPIINENDVVIGFGGRIMTDKKPKYINSKETIVYDKSCNLYGLNIAKNSKLDYFTLCEGYMDVIAMHQAGFDNAIASLGTALTPMQALKISKYKKRVILAYDSDEAGINAIKRAVPILEKNKISCKVLNMTPYKDPDEFIKANGKEKFQFRIENAIPVKTWLVKNLIADSSSYETKLYKIAKYIEN